MEDGLAAGFALDAGFAFDAGLALDVGLVFATVAGLDLGLDKGFFPSPVTAYHGRLEDIRS